MLDTPLCVVTCSGCEIFGGVSAVFGVQGGHQSRGGQVPPAALASWKDHIPTSPQSDQREDDVPRNSVMTACNDVVACSFLAHNDRRSCFYPSPHRCGKSTSAFYELN